MNLRYAALRRDLSSSSTSMLLCCAICFFSFAISAWASSSGEQKSASLRGVRGFICFFLDVVGSVDEALPTRTRRLTRGESASNCGNGHRLP
jgi:hypothetical protein